MAKEKKVVVSATVKKDLSDAVDRICASISPAPSRAALLGMAIEKWVEENHPEALREARASIAAASSAETAAA